MRPSLMLEGKQFNNEQWVVSVYSKGIPGHAAIVVEGVREDTADSFFEQYDIRYDPLHAVDGVDKYMVRTMLLTHNGDANTRPLAPNPSEQRNPILHYGILKYFEEKNARGKAMPATDAQAMVDRILREQTKNKSYHTARSEVAKCITRAGNKYFSDLPADHPERIALEQAQPAPGSNNRTSLAIIIKAGWAEMQTDPTVEYTEAMTALASWITENRYDPTYSQMVFTNNDAVGRSKNCATWCDKYLHRVGLQSSLVTSSTSVPRIIAQRGVGVEDRSKWLLGAGVITAVAGAGLWMKRGGSVKNLVETAGSVFKFGR